MRHPKWLSKTDLHFFPKNARQTILHVISLAHLSLIHSFSWAATVPALNASAFTGRTIPMNPFSGR